MEDSRQVSTLTRFSLVLGAGALLLGAFLPWAMLGELEVKGTSGDGKITLLCGAVVGILALQAWVTGKPSIPFGVGAAGAGAIALVIGLIDLKELTRIIGEIQATGLRFRFIPEPEAGIGLYLTIGGGALAVFGGALSIVGEPSKAADTPTRLAPPILATGGTTPAVPWAAEPDPATTEVPDEPAAAEHGEESASPEKAEGEMELVLHLYSDDEDQGDSP